MMTDRELLEKAASAIGIRLEWDGPPADWTPMYYQGKSYYNWNPLENDGDALRLALVIPACVVIDNDMRWCGIHLNGSRGKYDLVENFCHNPAAATRRAIVRAAAMLA